MRERKGEVELSLGTRGGQRAGARLPYCGGPATGFWFSESAALEAQGKSEETCPDMGAIAHHDHQRNPFAIARQPAAIAAEQGSTKGEGECMCIHCCCQGRQGFMKPFVKPKLRPWPGRRRRYCKRVLGDLGKLRPLQEAGRPRRRPRFPADSRVHRCPSRVHSPAGGSGEFAGGVILPGQRI